MPLFDRLDRFDQILPYLDLKRPFRDENPQNGPHILLFRHLWQKRFSYSLRLLSYGFTFGASDTHFRGLVSYIRGPLDVSGVYAAGNVGAALGRGGQAIVLTNQKGAELSLTGNSVGAIVSADLNGLVITVR